MKKIPIAIAEGDGIGPEIMKAVLRILDASDAPLEYNYCEIGENTIIGAGTVVTQHKKIPPNSLVLGSPGRIVRPLLDDEIEALHQSAIRYSLVAQGYVKK